MKYLLTTLALFLYLNLDAQNLQAKEIYIHYNDSIYKMSDIIKQVEENKSINMVTQSVKDTTDEKVTIIFIISSLICLIIVGVSLTMSASKKWD